jgi:hypothetical protein
MSSRDVWPISDWQQRLFRHNKTAFYPQSVRLCVFWLSHYTDCSPSTELNSWYMERRCNVFPVQYELKAYIILSKFGPLRTTVACLGMKIALSKIRGSQGGDYEDCRLLGYSNPVRTSQETHYLSATESSQLMLCNIWGFTAVTMKNVVFWDIKTQFVPHRSHITSQLQSPAG